MSSSSPRADVSPRSGDKASPRQNHVSTAMLHGVPIVCLMIDGRERLCLAQISNTLLKPYSYNEIHNRRVALGITCVQCTPVQLEILRRAGAMPISSRRCGMITKREAERLVKSFLDDSIPPKLPDNFAFDVKHECGWGSRGSFIPSRYNSSRAKCIKCSYCNMYFSPNKFIFHYHRAPDSKYHHPDAANFNSWRRHLTLTDSHPSDDLLHAWEDVKAMFNGGTRKRILTTATSKSFSSVTNTPSREHRPEVKRPKFDLDPSPHAPPRMPPPPPLQYPLFPINNKVLPPPMKTMPGNSVFGLHYGPDKSHRGPPVNNMKPSDISIPNIHETLYPPYEMIWAKHLGLTNTESSLVPPTARPPFVKQAPVPMKFPSQISPGKPPTNFSATSLIEGFDSSSSATLSDTLSGLTRTADHASAFKPVGTRKVDSLDDSVKESCFKEEHAMSCQDGDLESRDPSVLSQGDLIDDDEDDDESDCENVDVDTIDDGGNNELLEQNNNNGGKSDKSQPGSPSSEAAVTDTISEQVVFCSGQNQTDKDEEMEEVGGQNSDEESHGGDHQDSRCLWEGDVDHKDLVDAEAGQEEEEEEYIENKACYIHSKTFLAFLIHN